MRLRTKIPLLLAVMLILLSVSAFAYLAWMGGIERIANDQIRAALADRTNLDIHVGRIGGDLLSGFTLEDVKIWYADSTRRYLMADIPRLSTVYSFSNLWNRRYILEYLHIDSIDVVIHRDSLGGWLLPPVTSTGDQPASTPPHFSVGDLSIGAGSFRIIEADDTTRFDRISMAAAVEGDQGTFSVDLHRASFGSSLHRVFLDAAEGKITYAEKRALLRDITLASGRTRVRLDGNVVFADTVAGSVNYAANNVDLQDIAHYVGPNLHGEVDVNGTVAFVGAAFKGTAAIAGRLEIVEFDNLLADFRFSDKRLILDSLYGSILNGCTIDGNGSIDFNNKPLTYQLDADIRNFNLNELVNGTFDSDLTGRVRLAGESFSTRNLIMDLDVHLIESSFGGYPIHEAEGMLIVTTDSLVFVDPFYVDYYENVLRADGVIDFDDDIDLAIEIDLENLDRYRHTRLFIEQPGGRGHVEARLTGRTSDPDLSGTFASDSVWIYGLYADTMFAEVALERFLTGREGRVNVHFHYGAAWNIPYDTGYARLVIDSNVVYVDSLSAFNDISRLTGHATLDYMAQPQELRISDLSIGLLNQEFTNRSPLEIDVDTAGFVFSRAAVGNSEALLSVLGRVNYDETMDLLLAIERLPVAPWLNLVDTSYGVDGYLSCEAALKGSFRDPEFTLFGNIDSLSFRSLQLGVLSAGLDYQDRLLTIDSARILSEPGVYSAAGSLHVDLAFTADSVDRFPQEPMSVEIHASDRRFDLVSLVLPSVEQLDGDFWADFELYGTPHDPHLEGEAYIKEARLKYFDLEHPVFADSAGVTMRDNRIVIDKIEIYATENKKPDGRRRFAEIEGELRLLALDSLYYDLGIDIRKEFPFAYELDDIRGKVEGDLFVEGPTPPLVTGDLTLISAQYRVPFADDNASSPVMMALAGEDTWDLNINMDILSNYWIKNEDIDAEFAGQMNLIREDGNYRFIGEMEILRGRGFLFDKTFRLEPGSRVVFEGNDTLNPRLDITGYTRVATVRAAEEEGPVSEQIEVCISIGGTLEEPSINPCAGSDIDRADILPLIVTNTYADEGVNTGGQIEERLFGLGYAQMSQIGGRQLNQIGVETFEIDPVYGEELDPWNAWVTVGFYTGPSLYVYGRSTLAGQTRQEVGFEYRLNKAFLFEGRRDEDELYHLNLRVHWEF